VSSVYLGIPTTAGLLAGLLALVAVYRDAGRRGLSTKGRLSLAVGSAAGCVGAFLLPHAYGDGLGYVYFEVIKSEAITVSPSEWLAVSVATGLSGCVLVGGAYLTGIRYRSHPA
jgi:hypothetical protein